MICRRVVLVIENDEIGDNLWNRDFVTALIEFAKHSEKTIGAGQFPACFRASTGDKITAYAGTYDREVPLFAINAAKRNPLLHRTFNFLK